MLKKLRSFPEERYIASTAYTANEPDEIGFQKGVVVDVLQKNVDGWWLIRYSALFVCSGVHFRYLHDQRRLSFSFREKWLILSTHPSSRYNGKDGWAPSIYLKNLTRTRPCQKLTATRILRSQTNMLFRINHDELRGETRVGTNRANHLLGRALWVPFMEKMSICI